MDTNGCHSQVDDQQQPMSYVQTFNLLSDNGSYYVQNDVFRRKANLFPPPDFD